MSAGEATKARDMIGVPVRFFGQIWVIAGVNYLGDYDVLRYAAKRKVWQRSSISSEPLPPEHYHHWKIIASDRQRRLRRAIINAERLYPHLDEPHVSARIWRRARAWRGVLRRFFRRIQARPLTISSHDRP